MGVFRALRTDGLTQAQAAWPPAPVSSRESRDFAGPGLRPNPVSFKRSNVFSVFVDRMNPQPCAGFLFVAGGRIKQRRVGFLSGSGGDTQRPHRDLSAFLRGLFASQLPRIRQADLRSLSALAE